MSKLNLNNYTDREILVGLLDLPIEKFITLMNALAKTMNRMKDRGDSIASNSLDSQSENTVRRLFEGEEGPKE